MKKVLGPVFILFLLGLLAGCAGGLHGAAADGDIKTINKLLDDGANVNENGTGKLYRSPPLHQASYACQIEAVKLLLERGADVNAVGGKQGYTALHWASSRGCNDVIKLLIDKGADIDSTSTTLNLSPLAFAALGSRSDSVKLLLERGANYDLAMSALTSNTLGSYNKNDAIQMIKQAARKTGKGKTQIASNKETRPFVVKSDIDEIPAINAAARNNAYAVIIGIENYRSIPKSDYSRSDATLVKAYLKALGYQERNMELLTDEKATKTDIEKSLEAWLPHRAKVDSTVIVYFSGHGAPEAATGAAYLVPYDGDPGYLPVTGYSLKRLYENLGKLQAKEIIVVLDSCFSGSGGRSVLAKGARPLVMMAPTGILSANIAVLTAAQGSQISTSSPQKGHGVFTYYFLKAIKDGKNSIAEIYETITPQVEDEAKTLNVEQSPSIRPDMEKLKGRFNLRK